MAIRQLGRKVTENGNDRRAAAAGFKMAPQFEQPSSTSTVSLSTASLSTSTTKKLFDAPAEGKVIARLAHGQSIRKQLVPIRTPSNS